MKTMLKLALVAAAAVLAFGAHAQDFPPRQAVAQGRAAILHSEHWLGPPPR